MNYQLAVTDNIALAYNDNIYTLYDGLELEGLLEDGAVPGEQKDKRSRLAPSFRNHFIGCMAATPLAAVFSALELFHCAIVC
jgi:hypothetical protein